MYAVENKYGWYRCRSLVGLAQTRMLEMVKSELIMWVIMLGGSNSEKIAKKLLTKFILFNCSGLGSNLEVGEGELEGEG